MRIDFIEEFRFKPEISSLELIFIVFENDFDIVFRIKRKEVLKF